MILLHLQRTLLTATCIRKIRSSEAATAMDVTRPSVLPRTPAALPELANVLRDPETRLRCPFGDDWLEQFSSNTRLDVLHRLPFWLALLELHSDGYRYGIQGARDLPYVSDQLIECLTQKRKGTPARCFRARDRCAP